MAAGGPSAIFSPALSTTIRSAAPNTAFTRCSTSMIVIPPCRRRRTSWNVRAIPSLQRRAGGKPPSSRPSNRMLPSVGRKTAVIRLNSVVLPEPFGPISPTISPSAIDRSTRRTAARPPKYLETPASSRMPLPRTPGWCRILDLPRGLLRRPHENLTAVLPLVRHHDDLTGAVRIELDGAGDGRHVRRGDVVPNGVPVQSAGALDRIREDLDAAV